MNMNKKKEVQTWIAESKKKGYSPAQIEGELKKQGYSTDLIKEALGGSKNNNRGSKNVIALVILIVLILGVGGYFASTKLNLAENKLKTAEALLKEGNTDAALATYEEILTKYPNTKWEYLSSYQAGNIYFYKGDYERAISRLKRAVELNPDNACDSYNKLGRIYLAKSDYDTSLNYFSTALSLNEESKDKCTRRIVAETNLGVGGIYLDKGNYTGALDYLKAARKLNSNNAYIDYNLGRAYYFNNKYDAATVYLKSSLRLNNTGETASAAKYYLKNIQEKKKSA